jgi:hypothetical protein
MQATAVYSIFETWSTWGGEAESSVSATGAGGVSPSSVAESVSEYGVLPATGMLGPGADVLSVRAGSANPLLSARAGSWFANPVLSAMEVPAKEGSMLADDVASMRGFKSANPVLSATEGSMFVGHALLACGPCGADGFVCRACAASSGRAPACKS